jgi:hypothetical protein
MKSDCIVISSSSNDEIEIFEDEEVTADEKNKAIRDLHDLGFPVYGRPKATLHAEEQVKLCVGLSDANRYCIDSVPMVTSWTPLRMYCTTANLLLSLFLDVTV